MKFLNRLFPFLFIAILVLMAFAPVPTVAASPATVHLAAPSADIGVIDLIEAFTWAKGIVAGMLGISALLTMLVNFLKSRGYIKDGTAEAVSQTLLLVFTGIVALVHLFLPTFEFGILDELANSLVVAFPAMVAVVVILNKLFAPLIHKALRGVPVIGKSYSFEYQTQTAAKLPYSRGG